MKIYTCTDFIGHYPVGTAAVVRANSQADAAYLLAIALGEIGLPQKISPGQMKELTRKEGVTILNNGDY